MRWLFDRLFSERLEKQTSAYLKEVSLARVHGSRENAAGLVKRLASAQGPTLPMGFTDWGELLTMPVEEFMKSHAVLSGASGAGKTTFLLEKVRSLLSLFPETRTIGLGILDGKQELVDGTLYLIAKRLAELDRQAAREFRKRIVLIDFSRRDPVSSYNINVRWPSTDPEFFAQSRTDLLLELLPAGDGVSLGASALLKWTILLLSEFGLPITQLDALLHDEQFRATLVARSKNATAAAYFARQFPALPKQTVAALSRRMDALFASESVRLALSGPSAPDFRALADEGGRIVLVNVFGSDISRSVRRLLQAIVLSDKAHATFARHHCEHDFLEIIDEAQNAFATQHLRDHMMDLLTMARSFRTHLVLASQNMTTAIQDARVLSGLHTNIRWAFAMRGEPADCAFLRSALPVTGRRRKPRSGPFEEPSFYSLHEERALVLDEVASLPDRTGFWWMKNRSEEAIRLTVPLVTLPDAAEVKAAIEGLRRDPTFGMRLSRKEYDQRVAARDQEWCPKAAEDIGTSLVGTYRRARGGEA